MGQEVQVLPCMATPIPRALQGRCVEDEIQISSFWCELFLGETLRCWWGWVRDAKPGARCLLFPTASSPWASLPLEVAPTDSWRNEVLPVPKSGSLWCWHLLQMVSALLGPFPLWLAALKGVVLQQQFAGWKVFDGTR